MKQATFWRLCLLLWCAFAHAQSSDSIFRDGFDSDPRVAAARFLDQASFGGTAPEIQRVMQIGQEAWLTEQFAAPVSLQKPYLDWLRANSQNVYQAQRQEAWFIHSAQLVDPSNPLLTHNDQLRQRVAFALSELLVVSDKNAALLFQPWALADYYDVLSRNAFGNYRTLLKEVTLHPAMGKYLSMLGNRKTDTALNIRPDENYAREIMQLFSIGLVMLNPDGTVVLQNGQPVPTYGQNQVRGFAHVFTGWNFAGCTATNYADCEPSNPYEPGWTTPMASVAAFHDNSTNKQLLIYPAAVPANGLLVAGGSAAQEMDIAISNIFNHPNVGPFVSKHLILRLITSNPSPAYVGRVAAVFNNNGQGVRGDLQAVVRAILLDTEARNGNNGGSTFGKLREPITKLVKLWRNTNARSGNGRVFRYSHIRDEFAQFPLSAPSVFNFFKPNFAQPGEIRAAGLVSPEFQIATDTTLVSAPNHLGWRIQLFYVGSRYSVVWENGAPVPEETLMDYSALKTLAANPAQLIDHLNLVLMSGQMSNSMRSLLINRLNGSVPDQVPGQGPGAPDVMLWRVQQALYLIVNSPEFNIQK